jgi:ribosomal-protein-serine acetyltransferase
MEETLTLIVNADILLRQIEIADRDWLVQLINKEREYLYQWLEENGLKDLLEVGNFISISTVRYTMNGAFDAGIWYRDQLVGMVSLQTINRSPKRVQIYP